MSKELSKIGDVNVNQFAGGAERGVCLQLTLPMGKDFAQLTAPEVAELATTLNQWLDEQPCQIVHDGFDDGGELEWFKCLVHGKLTLNNLDCN